VISGTDFDAAILVGRFQPYHNGHAALLEKALAMAPRVIVVLGSAASARTVRNPFSADERATMIGSSLSAGRRSRVEFLPMRDYYDEERWAAALAARIGARCGANARLALIGFLKDATSQYLNRFPDWEFIAVRRQGEIDATRLRQALFEADDSATALERLAALMPAPVLAFLADWTCTPEFARLREEYHAIEESKKTWGLGQGLRMKSQGPTFRA
jgi:bifunctional NMN adenylyltransferase/nudix hydrolase